MNTEQRFTVLIADDDLDIRDLVVLKLERAGYDVISVSDGKAAMAAISRGRPDLVVLDVTMPQMSGLEVCRALRRAEETASLPVLLLTARAHERDVDAGYAAGVDDYLVKPFSPSDLVRRVGKLLDRDNEDLAENPP